MSLVAPFAADRELARQRFTEVGWIEVFLDPPYDVCLQRDNRGLYAALAARGGNALIDTEVLAIYERPTAPTLTLDTSRVDVETATAEILRTLDVS